MNILPIVLYNQPLLKRQSEFVIFLSYILLVYFSYRDLLSLLQNQFLYFTYLLNAEALLQLAEPDWLNWSHDKEYILGLADRPCYIT